MPRRAALGLIACAACVPEHGAQLPDFQDAKSAIYAIGRSEDVGGFARNAGAPVAFTVDRDQTSIGVAFYARTLEEMFLRDGALVADPKKRESHKLPAPSAAFLARPGDDGELGVFEPVPLDSVLNTAPFDAVTIDQPTPTECVTAGGCYDTTPDPICIKPCAPVEPEKPAPPTAPHVTCAPGWTPRKIFTATTAINGADLSEVVTCDPTPNGAVPTCTEGQMWRPPLPGCVAVTRPCPIAPEKWADDLPATGVVYVDRDTPSPPGDGSKSAPFASIALAMANAVPGSTVALAAQDFGETFSVTRDLTVRGACASTIVDSINVDGRSSVRDLTVRPSLHFGIAVYPGAHASLSNLIVETQSSTRSIGIDLLGTTTVAHVLVNAHGYGIIAHGDRASILDTQIAGAQTYGIHVSAGTAQIARTAILSDGGSGALSYAFTEVADSLIEGTGAAALHANSAGTLVAHRTVVRNIPRAYGMLAQGGGTIRADSLIIDGVDGFAIEVTERSSVALDDSVVMNIHEPGGDSAGLVFLVDGSELRARRTLFAHFDTTGIIFGRDAIGDLQDVAFLDLRSVDHAMTTVGRLSSLTMERALYFGSSNLAIRLVGDDFVDTPARLVMRDVTIDSAGADGIQASRAVDLTMERVSIANTRRAAIQVRETATARISDLTIDGVTEAKDECVFECTGFGIAAGIDSMVTVDRFLIQGAADTCVNAGGGSLDLFHGIVRDCPIGIGANDRDYDLRRLLVDVDARGATEPVVEGQ